jgi:hypothetical protein
MEVEQLKRDTRELKEIVAELLLETHRLKKMELPQARRPVRKPQMSAAAKGEVIEKVQSSSLPVKKVLNELSVPRSNYYRWIKQKQPSPPAPLRVPWNRLRSVEEERVLEVARASPEWSSRQVAAWVTDNTEFSISEASVTGY